MSDSKHSVRFPGESESYRAARNELLEAEIQLRRSIEDVAAKRRDLPLGGKVPEDYVFDEAVSGSADRKVRLSELCAPDKDTLMVYSFMYGPKMAQPCVSCTSILDALDGEAPHVMQRINLAVVAKSPISRIMEFTTARGWRNLRLLSSSGNTYNHDYHAESPDFTRYIDECLEAPPPLLKIVVRSGLKKGDVRFKGLVEGWKYKDFLEEREADDPWRKPFEELLANFKPSEELTDDDIPF